MTIGGRIRIARRSLNLNQTEFGARLGLSQAAIAGYENDSHSVAEQTLIHICKEYKVSEVWLRTGEGEMFDDNGDDFVSELAAKYDLNPFQQNLARIVYEMPLEHQEIILDFARRLLAGNDAVQSETDEDRTRRLVKAARAARDAEDADQGADERA